MRQPPRRRWRWSASDPITEALGSTLALADSAGVIQTSYTYEPYGNTTQTGQANSNPFQYTGRENDGTGLYYYRARYYDAVRQRFISEDPIEFEGGDLNLARYVGNDPLSWSDPDGLSKKDPNTTSKPCSRVEYGVCQAQCGNKGVLRCQIQVTKKIRRIINNNGSVLKRLHFDEKVNCECGDDDPPVICPPPAGSGTKSGAGSGARSGGGGGGGGGRGCLKGLPCGPGLQFQ